jgi:hypothetical protein
MGGLGLGGDVPLLIVTMVVRKTKRHDTFR